ncbi:MAG: TolC family protein [Planctomycetota bacterium]|nr:TolC family protein [Planctomycetota bacterium]
MGTRLNIGSGNAGSSAAAFTAVLLPAVVVAACIFGMAAGMAGEGGTASAVSETGEAGKRDGGQREPPAAGEGGGGVKSTAAGEGEGERAAGKDGARKSRNPIVLSLNDCIEMAVQNNLGLLQTRLQDSSAALDVAAAKSRYLPVFSLGATAAGSDAGVDSKSLGGSLSVSQKTPWGTELDYVVGATQSKTDLTPYSRGISHQLTVTQPLWRSAGLDAGMYEIRSAEIRRLSSRARLELAVQQLIFQTRQSYSNCVRATHLLAVNRRALESARKFVMLSQARERAGQVTKLDVFNAEIQQANREVQLVAAETNLEAAYDALKRIMDVDLAEGVRVEFEDVDFGESAPADQSRVIETAENPARVDLVIRRRLPAAEGREERFEEISRKNLFTAVRFDEDRVLSEALGYRIEIARSRYNAQLARLTSLLRKDGLGLQVDLSGTVRGYGSGEDWSDAGEMANTDMSASLRVTIPWGKVSDRVAYEKALLDMRLAEIDLKNTRVEVKAEVRDLMRRLRQAEATIMSQAKQVEQAKRSAEAAQISFERGLKDSFAVVLAEDDLLNAKVGYINSTLNYQILLAELDRVRGVRSGRVVLDKAQGAGDVKASPPSGKGLPAREQ